MAKISQERKRELIKVKLAQIIQRASNNPHFEGVTIVDVKISPDGSKALVFFTLYDASRDIERITKALRQACGFFQGKLAQTLTTRNTPKLNFVFDKGFDHAEKIDSILRTLELDPTSE
ncbi:MAG: ribosome-binding factor A [SAR324 cluster bacterium]|uniref:Ribosome-binding factor A n=1 Tax=SAR324 cluster bacterium TaxID=2024889 RepID=A0A2A4SP63_9DELT|nr:MAG: ribosome-binding factor A [SAR324 cluster bacterium]